MRLNRIENWKLGYELRNENITYNARFRIARIRRNRDFHSFVADDTIATSFRMVLFQKFREVIS